MELEPVAPSTTSNAPVTLSDDEQRMIDATLVEVGWSWIPHLTGFAKQVHKHARRTPDLVIEVDGTPHGIVDGVKALHRKVKAERQRQIDVLDANSRSISEPPETFRARQWGALSKIERALHVAAHESTDPKEHAFIKRLVSTIRRTPNHTNAPAPDGVDF